MWIRQDDAITNITTHSFLKLNNKGIRLETDLETDRIAIFKTQEAAEAAFEIIWQKLVECDVTLDLSEVQDEQE